MYFIDQTREAFFLGFVPFQTEKIMNEAVDKLSNKTN